MGWPTHEYSNSHLQLSTASNFPLDDEGVEESSLNVESGRAISLHNHIRVKDPYKAGWPRTLHALTHTVKKTRLELYEMSEWLCCSRYASCACQKH